MQLLATLALVALRLGTERRQLVRAHTRFRRGRIEFVRPHFRSA